ncbi:hypothetical protein [Nannocystis pusilla]|uniref:hypothetical protein n=1 Tax=Nannocystis pusilla TaxID=889268 RepID=UPI003B798DCF
MRTLSFGQVKRTYLAAATIGAPPLWILDEPSNGLDPAGGALVATLLHEHAAAGGAALVATNDARFVSLCPGQVVRLVDGALREEPRAEGEDAGVVRWAAGARQRIREARARGCGAMDRWSCARGATRGQVRTWAFARRVMVARQRIREARARGCGGRPRSRADRRAAREFRHVVGLRLAARRLEPRLAHDRRPRRRAGPSRDGSLGVARGSARRVLHDGCRGMTAGVLMTRAPGMRGAVAGIRFARRRDAAARLRATRGGTRRSGCPTRRGGRALGRGSLAGGRGRRG